MSLPVFDFRLTPHHDPPNGSPFYGGAQFDAILVGRHEE